MINRWYDELQKRALGMSTCAPAYNASDTDNALNFLFIDEFEGVGSDRMTDRTNTMAGTVPSLLQAIEGVKSSDRVVTIAATNLPWQLDTALLRRFTVKILVDLPGNKARISIITEHLFKAILGGNNQDQHMRGELKRDINPIIYSVANATGWQESSTSASSASSASSELVTAMGLYVDEKIPVITDKIVKFMTKGNHYQIRFAADSKELEEAVAGHQWSAPRHKFGFTASDIVSIMTKTMNRFAKLMLTRMSYDGTKITVAAKDVAPTCCIYGQSCPKCEKLPNKNVPKITSQIFLANIKEYVEILAKVLAETKSSVNAREYSQMVAYAVFDKHERINKAPEVNATTE